eukprot:SAG31_NODE_41983_length_273_cov_1.183908_1_plen_34_part_01
MVMCVSLRAGGMGGAQRAVLSAIQPSGKIERSGL